MGMAVNTNLAALNAHRNLSNTQNDLSKSLEKLSSGLRINRAADDAAGLSISEGLRSQVNGMTVATRNAQDGISVVQTAEGALNEVHSILQRMRDLAVQAGNDSNSDDSRTAIDTEAKALSAELGRITESTNFNGIKLLQGTPTSDPMSFQVGANGDASSQITVKVADLKTALTGVVDLDYSVGGATPTAAKADMIVKFSDATEAAKAVTDIDAAIKNISTTRSELGASQNRFESAINTLNVSRENLQAAESRIRDVDMAAEMVNFTRSNILSQAGTAMLAQANQSNQGVLQLLG
ncbi:flagellin N-terminal helical domain-containing protein [Paeniglutamicibacter psychrophenolicus]|uniref:flagellin N-terminal helical domain-containing protein n=1 Tax=Paeniglutamicibacter psychrophenolicus TaxID=257454 RepID=UPI00277EC682|nr:flagellin [Paeniglutamicibacter psychrophenolicus]MDQ0094651.1 flagellin [Paeniglutamicibacter psychrophenolicus]